MRFLAGPSDEALGGARLFIEDGCLLSRFWAFLIAWNQVGESSSSHTGRSPTATPHPQACLSGKNALFFFGREKEVYEDYAENSFASFANGFTWETVFRYRDHGDFASLLLWMNPPDNRSRIHRSSNPDVSESYRIRLLRPDQDHVCQTRKLPNIQ